MGGLAQSQAQPPKKSVYFGDRRRREYAKANLKSALKGLCDRNFRSVMDVFSPYNLSGIDKVWLIHSKSRFTQILIFCGCCGWCLQRFDSREKSGPSKCK